MEKKTNKSTTNSNPLSKQYGPLFDFFTDGIKDIFWAEQAIAKQLKELKTKAHTEELSEAIEDHELQTQKHITRLQKVFKHLGMTPEAKKCEAIAGILKEGEECIEKTPEDSMTRDAVMIICAQKVEHYEIASYGGLLQLALTFELEDIAELLDKTLVEEYETDDLLTDIAESFINIEAAAEEDEDHDNSDNDELNDGDDLQNSINNQTEKLDAKVTNGSKSQAATTSNKTTTGKSSS